MLRLRQLRKRAGEQPASATTDAAANPEPPAPKKARAVKSAVVKAVALPAPPPNDGDRVLYQYPALVPAILLRRYKRFLADVVLLDSSGSDAVDESDAITIYCPNTGPMVGLLDQPHTRVQLSKSDDPKRKYAYTLEMVRIHNGHRHVWVGVHSTSANYMVEKALQSQWLAPELGKFDTLQREVKFNAHSRVDFVLSTLDADGDVVHQKYIEVKSVTLALSPQDEGSRCAVFPDTVSARASKHVSEMTELVATRKQAIEKAEEAKPTTKPPAKLSGALVFLLQRDDCQSFMPSVQHDAKFAKLCAEAEASGIQLAAYACSLQPHEASQTGRVTLLGPVPLHASRVKGGASLE